ncbi:MAG: hypothetical protein ACREP3_15340 [Candidatus Binatia bacterium]
MKMLIVFLFLLFCAQAAQAQELKKIKVGYPAISYNQIHIWIAKDAGLFRKSLIFKNARIQSKSEV